jgi:hypothetical protein
MWAFESNPPPPGGKGKYLKWLGKVALRGKSHRVTNITLTDPENV